MELNERDSFAKLLISVAALYDKELSTIVIKLYWTTLQIYSLEDVMKAFRIHTEDPDGGNFMPKPADIIRVIKGNSQSQCLIAWSKVERAIRLIGPYSSVVFDDVIIQAVLHEMGGWIKICQTKGKDYSFVGREFQTRYSTYRYHPPSSYPNYLVGITEQQNLTQGFNITPPLLVGDIEKAKIILEQGNRSCNLAISTASTSSQLEKTQG